MALYNEILAPRFNNMLKKYLNMKGQAPAPQLSGEIGGNFNFPLGYETRFLEGWYRYTNVFNQVAVPGLTTACRLRNRANSGFIAVIESLKIWSAAAQNMVLRMRDVLADGDLGTISPALSIERRATRQFSSVSTSIDLAGSQTGTAFYQFPMPAGGPPFEVINFDEQELVLDPGQWFQLYGDLANTAWVANFTWRERALEDSEVTRGQ